MNVRLPVPLVVAALTLWAPHIPGAFAQGGWVTSVNPGWVQQPLPSGITSPGTHETQSGIPISGPRPRIPPPLPEANRRPDTQRTPSERPLSVTPKAHDVTEHHDDRSLHRERYLYLPAPVIALAVQHRRDRSEAETGASEVYIGMRRADLVRMLGRPNAAVYQASGHETLLFNALTVIVQNGIVADIQ